MIDFKYLFSLNCIAWDGQLIKGLIKKVSWESVGKQIYEWPWHSSCKQALCEWEYKVLEQNRLSYKPTLVLSPLLRFCGSSNKVPGTFKQKVSTNDRFFTVFSAQPLRWKRLPLLGDMMGFLFLNSWFELLRSCPLVVPYQFEYFLFLNFFSFLILSLVRSKPFHL